MKILHLLSSNKFSGAENVACQIIHMFSSNADMQFVYCSPDGPIRQALADRNISFAPLNSLSPLALKKILWKEKPDVVHAHDMKASVVASAVVGRIPLISHIHNNSFDSQKPTVKSVLYRIAANKIKHTFWVSKAAQEGYYFRASVRNKSSVLYNVIDTEQLEQKANQAENQTAYDVVYLGRLTYPKNPERLVSVLEQAIAQRPDLTAAIIGAGELEEDVHRLVKEKNLSDNIHCLGFMSNPYGIVQNAKVMLMTSRWEGLPMCALEALALGVPIVSTPTDGLQELLENGTTGYLADEDRVLAEKLCRIISDTQLQQNMSANALEQTRCINDTAQYATTVLTQYFLE